MKPFKFIHMADTHLGNVQYHLFERFRDFNRAFNAVLHKALEENVDFIIHAGDFFNSNRINPETLSACYLMIKQFQDKAVELFGHKIPIIVIEGNHDKRNYFAKRSWLKFLADLDLISLLSINFQENQSTGIFKPYSAKKKIGNVVSIGDAKIYGIPSYGALTQELLPKIYNSLPSDDDRFNILIMHFGIQGQVKGKLGLEITPDLNAIHEKIDYLALGHYHKHYSLPENNPWIYNPGSTEINAPKELYGDNGEPFQRGVFLVEVFGKAEEQRRVQLIEFENGENEDSSTLPNRAFYNVKLDVEGISLSNFDDLTDFVIEQVKKQGFTILSGIKREQLNFRDLNLPFLYISIFGTIPFSKLDLNFSKMRKKILNTFQIFETRIFAQGLASEMDDISIIKNENRTVDDIETEILTKMISLHPEYQLYTNEIVKLMKDLKKPLLSKRTGNSVFQEIIAWWNSIFPKKEAEMNFHKDRKTLADFLPSSLSSKPSKNKYGEENTEKERLKDLNIERKKSDEEEIDDDEIDEEQVEEELDNNYEKLNYEGR
ncbi:MAG: exonuclease SbcCD subunit D [Candidatus Lokiarchaeota archaeon]|nr:exonuclease SbcCD subunit D [Candidatus Harpocratesius repetitus]